MTKIRSPLRYPGGKQRVLKRILERTPEQITEYREPFLGGGSVFIALKQIYPNAKFKIGDFNRDLCSFWVTLRDNSNDFIDEIIRIKKTTKNGRELHKKLKSQKNNNEIFQQAIRFYVLNRITYSGTIDSGGYSEQAFRKRFTFSRISQLKGVSDLLQGVEILNESYEKLLFENGENVFIYLDPPYWKSRKSKLYGKNGDLHSFFDHFKFAQDVAKCEHHWLMTCDNSKIMRELFSENNRRPENWSYGMTNVNGRKTIIGNELFVSNNIF